METRSGRTARHEALSSVPLAMVDAATRDSEAPDATPVGPEGSPGAAPVTANGSPNNGAWFEDAPLAVRWFEGERLRAIREMVAEDPGHRILEIGGATGHVLRMFRRSRLTLVDESSEHIEAARRTLAGYDAEFRVGRIDQLGLPAGSFDRVICTQVLEHVAEPGRVLDEIARLLAPGGRAIVTAGNGPLSVGVKRVLRYSPARWAIGSRVDPDGGPRKLHHWTADEFRRMLLRHFHIEEQRSIPFAWLPLRVSYLCRVREPGLRARGRIES